MNKVYFTCFRPDGKEHPCNVYTRRWGWLIRLYRKIRGNNNGKYLTVRWGMRKRIL